MNIISENIAFYRRKKGLTQKELAKKIGVSPAFISHLENGVSGASEDTLEKILNVLEIDKISLSVPADYDPYFDKKEDAQLVDLLIDMTINDKIFWNYKSRDAYGIIETYETVINDIYYSITYPIETQQTDKNYFIWLDLCNDDRKIYSIMTDNNGSKVHDKLLELIHSIWSIDRDKSPIFKIINDLEKIKDEENKD